MIYWDEKIDKLNERIKALEAENDKLRTITDEMVRENAVGFMETECSCDCTATDGYKGCICARRGLQAALGVNMIQRSETIDEMVERLSKGSTMPGFALIARGILTAALEGKK